MSLVNQMLRDLELRQSGRLAADGGVLSDMDAVREPLSAPDAEPFWRVAMVVLALVVVAALLVAAAQRRAPWWAWQETPSASAQRSSEFRSSVTPAPSLATVNAIDRHPPVQALPEGGADSLPAPAAWTGLRLARELLGPAAGADPSPALARATPDAALTVSAPGKAALPADLGAVAARFDREFTASLGSDDPPAASPALAPVSTPTKVKTATRTSAAERADALYVAAASAGSRVEAEAGLQAALQANPAHADARRTLATLMLQSGRFDAADRLLAEADPISPALAVLHARALLELGRDAEALAVLEPALGPRADANQRALHAALLQRLGDHAGASEAYRQVLAAHPGNGVWWMGLGISQEALGRVEQTRDAYQRALASGQLGAALIEFVNTRLAAL